MRQTVKQIIAEQKEQARIDAVARLVHQLDVQSGDTITYTRHETGKYAYLKFYIAAAAYGQRPRIYDITSDVWAALSQLLDYSTGYSDGRRVPEGLRIDTRESVMSVLNGLAQELWGAGAHLNPNLIASW